MAADRDTENMDKLRMMLEDLETMSSALDFFEDKDDEVFGAIRDLLNHHLVKVVWVDGKNGKRRKAPRFDGAGADASWRLAREKFWALCQELRDPERRIHPSEAGKQVRAAIDRAFGSSVTGPLS